MKKYYIYIAFLIFAVTGCSNNLKSKLGLKRSAPDEFSVISNQPLIIPPSMQLSRENKVTNVTTLIGIEEDIKNSKSNQTAETKEDTLFLKDLGKSNKKTDIKKKIDAESKKDNTSKKGFLRNMLSKVRGEKKEKVINPELEKERIEKNIKENIPINQGKVHEKDISKSTIESILK